MLYIKVAWSVGSFLDIIWNHFFLKSYFQPFFYMHSFCTLSSSLLSSKDSHNSYYISPCGQCIAQYTKPKRRWCWDDYLLRTHQCLSLCNIISPHKCVQLKGASGLTGLCCLREFTFFVVDFLGHKM